MNDITIRVIARMKSDFPTKFGIPRQSGLVEELHSTIIFEPEYRNPDALRGIEEFSHIWLIWQFSEAVRQEWSPTVRPPRLGGNTRMGVFATRSPFRPNNLGLSSVRLEEIRWEDPAGPVLIVSGVDMLDGTPIFDIKPYIPVADCHPEASEGYTKDTRTHALSVTMPPELSDNLPKDVRGALLGILENDPRPGYEEDPTKEYGLSYAGYEVAFSVEGEVLRVLKILQMPKE